MFGQCRVWEKGRKPWIIIIVCLLSLRNFDILSFDHYVCFYIHQWIVLRETIIKDNQSLTWKCSHDKEVIYKEKKKRDKICRFWEDPKMSGDQNQMWMKNVLCFLTSKREESSAYLRARSRSSLCLEANRVVSI